MGLSCLFFDFKYHKSTANFLINDNSFFTIQKKIKIFFAYVNLTDSTNEGKMGEKSQDANKEV